MGRVFVILSLTMCASGFVYTGLITTMPKLFETGLGPAFAASYTEIGVYVGAVMGLASFSSILGGWLADRFSARAVYIVFWSLTVPPVLLSISSAAWPAGSHVSVASAGQMSQTSPAPSRSISD